MDPPFKKLKTQASPDEATLTENASPASLNRPISPPPRSRQPSQHQPTSSTTTSNTKQSIPSPIQLTHIRDLPSANQNAETIRLPEILGDPLIRECWQFNYLIDVDFVMSQFDADVRGLVQLKVVHGSWKREAPNRIRIDVSPCLLLISTCAYGVD